ncbi:peptidase M24 [Crepidotus variabilis]|uniref:Peptidase M24 n=1 Tax=Crepidotus variabilis TaxID=179855 RepID=A0A9P6EBC0_9AGAR|nr:peptidase M24 [Crepidotus variabilis]
MLARSRQIPSRLSHRAVSTKPSRYGQPTISSHPHLIRKDDLTPGIPASDYETRRRKLMEMLPEKSLVVSVAGPVKYMSSSAYKYRPSSNFWYLTGFEEPDSAVVLEKDSSSRGYKMTLFCSGTDSSKEKWDGANTSLADAKTIFAAEESLSISSLSSHLNSLLSSASHVFFDPPTPRPPTRNKTKRLLRYLSGPSDTEKELLEDLPSSMRRPLAPLLGKLRLVKTEAELGVMRAAADISARAHTKTMRFTEPGMSEHAVTAHFEYLCAREGSQRPAYVPVVASGPNSLILHYTRNNQIIEDGELVLVDAGCEFNGYASDITRTYPANGTFTAPQRDIYNAVLSAQKEMIKICTERAGHSLQELHRQSCRALQIELKQVGFSCSEGDLERVLYPHYLGHPIGIDLHESTYLDRSAPLKAGMVITIEPGLYIPPISNFPRHFHNIGVRIEDEVVVGTEHASILSVSAPKEIDDIEGACQGLLGLKPF